ncbi:MAG: tyrosine--tRNA ligase, partial [Bacteroidales bacterium]|nr:tyrosine--tRNA ligase [Bacteroidales bacterium]
IKIFTLLTEDEINSLIAAHAETPHMRLLQKRLAKEVTVMVHSEEEYNAAIEASQILFGKGTTASLTKLDEATFLSVFEGVPTFEVEKSEIDNTIDVLTLFAEKTSIFPSKGECRKMIKGGGVSLNKAKVTDETTLISTTALLNNKYLLVQRGKKNYFIISVK